MFLDRELRNIGDAKRMLSLRGELNRSLLRLEMLAMKTRTRSVFSGLSAGLALAGLLKELLGKKGRDR